MKRALPLLAFSLAAPALATSALAQESRQMDAHVHGVGILNIAIDGKVVAMEFHAPGADIVGFEYAAKSDEDRATVDSAIATLAQPLDLFVLPDAAACTVTSAAAALELEEDHDEHDHDEEHAEDEDHDEHDHDEEHAEGEDHDDHDHDEEHAEGEDHDEHDHDEEHAEGDEHDEHDHDEEHAEHEEHDDHDHDEEHADEAGHTEFHAEYTLDCANPDALSEITFAYFDQFENAVEVEVQIISAKGAAAFEVERDAPVLNLQGQL